MDREKSQRVALGLVAALAVGAGGYCFVFRDSGHADVQSTVNEVSQRRTAPTEPSSGFKPKAVEKEAVTSPESIHRPEPKEPPDEGIGARRKPQGGERTRKQGHTTAA
ncbi:MAG: hypothetical protein HY287_09985 [Planctomycetes bacterium]|nr:hypothetical protein [Planctomycetota bacterium]MBI3834644.1 hypothetical protein [Planctomycetota bacterium]